MLSYIEMIKELWEKYKAQANAIIDASETEEEIKKVAYIERYAFKKNYDKLIDELLTPRWLLELDGTEKRDYMVYRDEQLLNPDPELSKLKNEGNLKIKDCACKAAAKIETNKKIITEIKNLLEKNKNTVENWLLELNGFEKDKLEQIQIAERRIEACQEFYKIDLKSEKEKYLIKGWPEKKELKELSVNCTITEYYNEMKHLSQNDIDHLNKIEIETNKKRDEEIKQNVNEKDKKLDKINNNMIKYINEIKLPMQRIFSESLLPWIKKNNMEESSVNELLPEENIAEEKTPLDSERFIEEVDERGHNKFEEAMNALSPLDGFQDDSSAKVFDQKLIDFNTPERRTPLNPFQPSTQNSTTVPLMIPPNQEEDFQHPSTFFEGMKTKQIIESILKGLSKEKSAKAYCKNNKFNYNVMNNYIRSTLEISFFTKQSFQSKLNEIRLKVPEVKPKNSSEKNKKAVGGHQFFQNHKGQQGTSPSLPLELSQFPIKKRRTNNRGPFFKQSPESPNANHPTQPNPEKIIIVIDEEPVFKENELK